MNQPTNNLSGESNNLSEELEQWLGKNTYREIGIGFSDYIIRDKRERSISLADEAVADTYTMYSVYATLPGASFIFHATRKDLSRLGKKFHGKLRELQIKEFSQAVCLSHNGKIESEPIPPGSFLSFCGVQHHYSYQNSRVSKLKSRPPVL